VSTAAIAYEQPERTPWLVQFHDASVGEVASRLFVFGDAATGREYDSISTDADPMHTYPATGSFIATLEVRFADGTRSVARARIEVPHVPRPHKKSSTRSAGLARPA
jgi:hypothetical protein